MRVATFSLGGPDLTYTIPLLKKIRAINPGIKVLATPWTAPTWMKSNLGWTGGSLQPAYWDAYAAYFKQYLEAMAAQGIHIWAITPQNEPENPYLWRQDRLGETERGLGRNLPLVLRAPSSEEAATASRRRTARAAKTRTWRARTHAAGRSPHVRDALVDPPPQNVRCQHRDRRDLAADVGDQHDDGEHRQILQTTNAQAERKP